jgi:hypothetical protein
LLGDGVLAFLGTPQAHEDDPERAIHAALSIQEEMRDYAAISRRGGWPSGAHRHPYGAGHADRQSAIDTVERGSATESPSRWGLVSLSTGFRLSEREDGRRQVARANLVARSAWVTHGRLQIAPAAPRR